MMSACTHMMSAFTTQIHIFEASIAGKPMPLTSIGLLTGTQACAPKPFTITQQRNAPARVLLGRPREHAHTDPLHRQSNGHKHPVHVMPRQEVGGAGATLWDLGSHRGDAGAVRYHDAVLLLRFPCVRLYTSIQPIMQPRNSSRMGAVSHAVHTGTLVPNAYCLNDTGTLQHPVALVCSFSCLCSFLIDKSCLS